MVKKKQRRKRRVFTPEFRAEAVRLCKVGDRTMSVAGRKRVIPAQSAGGGQNSAPIWAS